MFKVIFTTIIFSVFGNLSLLNAQQKMLSLTIAPSSVLNPKINTGFNLGTLYQINNNWQLLAEFTFPFKSNQRDSFTYNNKFLKTKLEARYYLPSIKSLYIGLQFAYVNRKFDVLKSSFFYENSEFDDYWFKFSKANVVSPIFTTTFQLGFQFKILKNLTGDYFGGIGYRNISTQYNNIIDLQRLPHQPVKDRIFFTGQNAYKINNIVHRVQLNLGIRFIYQLPIQLK